VEFHPSLVQGRLIRRYKRFFVDVKLADGRTVVAHCPNTGALRGCLREGARVALERSNNPKRKLAWTWVLIQVGGRWVGVHTGLAVPLVQEALAGGKLFPELAGYERTITEVQYGREGRSRIDLLLSRGGSVIPGQKIPVSRRMRQGDERVYVEVKNTTLVRSECHGGTTLRMGAFPDAVTERGRKHLDELVGVVEEGHRAAMVYVAQRSDCDRFRPADEIDPAYGVALREAKRAGVELYAVRGRVGVRRMGLDRRLPLDL
jgi:sugar fermentation stimulation protein A